LFEQEDKMTIRDGKWERQLSEIRELEEKLFETTRGYDFEIIFLAFQSMIVFWMAQVRADCRGRVMRHFKKTLPSMLAAANEFAEENPEAAQHHTHRHH
jgi:hypothetical protein